MYAITFLTTDLAYGGAEHQLVNLAIKLKARGWRIQVVSMLQPQAFVHELASSDIPVASLDMRQGVPDPRAIIKLAAILRQNKPHILHSHMVHANLLARVTRPLCRVPIQVSTAHNIDEGGRWREVAYRLTDPLCDMTTQVSQAGLDRYVRVGAVRRDKIVMIPNGVDVERYRPDAVERQSVRGSRALDGLFVWLAVGRFAEAKNYPNLVKAFSLLSRDNADAVLLIAGEGPQRSAVEKLAAQLRISDRVRFLGLRKDIPSIMNAADAYVMSSDWEGMPLVLQEASATGLPIVATDVGGNTDVVQDQHSGFLTPPQNSIALKEAMARLMGLPESERKQMGEYGLTYTRTHYSLESVLKAWETLYTGLLEEHPGIAA